jgi:hypothetical protein
MPDPIFRPAVTDINLNVAADVDAAVAAGVSLRLLGFAVREDSAAVASFEIVEGATGAGGTLLIPVGLAASESKLVWFGPNGIACPGGLSVKRLAGQCDLVLFYSKDN